MNGLFYIGELHPFKQYQGSKARFDTGAGELECFVHRVSEFFAAAKNDNYESVDWREWFDDDNRTAIPRLLTAVFKARK